LPVIVRAANEQSIPEELVQRIADITARFAELGAFIRQGSASGRDVLTIETRNSSRPIEFLTENGFSIERPWETNGSPSPTDGTCCFLVSDPQAKQREVEVEISRGLLLETSFHTRQRIEPTSSFWICCAERRLADYLWEHEAFPDGDRLLVEILDPEEVILAMRWEKSD
jgi:hypothetical protein